MQLSFLFLFHFQLPLTRPKSPNLTRRKSCGDVHSTQDERAKTCCRAHRHSLGSHREQSATANEIKSKSQVSGQNSNGAAGKLKDRAKQVRETKMNAAPPKMTEPSSANITVQS